MTFLHYDTVRCTDSFRVHSKRWMDRSHQWVAQVMIP